MRLLAGLSSRESRLDKEMNNRNMPSGMLLRIERASIHDGQGLRTVLFLKGCPLNCAWCSTPESQRHEPERAYNPALCTTCGSCIRSCPAGALSLDEENKIISCDLSICNTCFHCVDNCPQKAIIRFGSKITVEEALQEISRDEIFYFHSGGGVTIGGGEPLSQPAFVAALLRKCKSIGIHTAIESSFHAPTENILKVLPWLDQAFVDIKHMDKTIHAQWTGEESSLILNNINCVDTSNFPLTLIIRIPLVPGFNDSDKNLKETIQFCNGLKKLSIIELLPYHRLGVSRYSHLGIAYRCPEIEPPSSGYLLERLNFLKKQCSSIPITIGSGFSAA